MKTLLTVIILNLIFIQACSNRNWVDVGNPYLKTRTFSGQNKNYKIGEKNTAILGQSIIQVVDYESEVVPQIQFPRDTSIILLIKSNEFISFISKNTVYPLNNIIIYNKNVYYLFELPNSTKYIWHIMVSEDGIINKNAIYSKVKNAVYFSDVNISSNVGQFDLIFQDKTSNIKQKSKYEIIYSGINDVSLNVTYREYAGGNFAKPTFFQNIISGKQARQIRYKNFLIQIHEVTNESITYTVLEDGLI